MKPLKGRVALVTGASRSIGIGAAICRRLADDGADIAFTHFLSYDTEMYGSPEDGPDQLKRELEDRGARVFALDVDLSQPDIASGLFDRLTESLGAVDILVNNAAYSTHDAWDTLTEASLDRHLAVNSRATAMLTVEFARRFGKDEGGRVVNFSSGQHLGPMPNELAYAASKGAIIAFSRSIAPDLARRGITINVVNPGPTDTGWMDDDLKAALLDMNPLGRIGQPEDAARLVAWLVSDEAGWITGQVIDSEGAFSR
ncbi:MAG: SDR family oxidoreductase [Chloroflexia bacterium]|nr:SDR family oxidoreductase [Chloroflexia bacterium]